MFASPPPRLADTAFVALRPRGVSALGIDEARRALDASGLPVRTFSPSGARSVPGAIWEAEVLLDVGAGETFSMRVACAPSPVRAAEIAATLRGALDLDASDLVAARASATSIHVVAALGGTIADLHDVLRVLVALAPDLVAYFDLAALAVRPRGWVLDAAAARTPPAPETLFTLHAVGDGGPVWIHSHGLARLGIIELDACAVAKADSGLVAQMLNTTAKFFLERGVPPADEPFEVARGMPIVWLPWEKGVSHVGRAPGGARDREDEDHRGARGLLFAKTRGFFGGTKYVPLSHWSSALRGHPVFFVSDMETARAASLAAERLPRFEALFTRFAGKPRWKFLVKLGYEVDGAVGPQDREHLWFEVHVIRDGRAEATCLNQPHQVSALREGLRGTHELSRISGFQIFCDRGGFDAERLDVLERALEDL